MHPSAYCLASAHLDHFRTRALVGDAFVFDAAGDGRGDRAHPVPRRLRAFSCRSNSSKHGHLGSDEEHRVFFFMHSHGRFAVAPQQHPFAPAIGAGGEGWGVGFTDGPTKKV